MLHCAGPPVPPPEILKMARNTGECLFRALGKYMAPMTNTRPPRSIKDEGINTSV